MPIFYIMHSSGVYGDAEEFEEIEADSIENAYKEAWDLCVEEVSDGFTCVALTEEEYKSRKAKKEQS